MENNLKKKFLAPSLKYFPRPLWFWNGTPTTEKIKEIMRNCRDKDGYGGFGILPFEHCELKYMSDEYLRLYGDAVKTAAELDMKMCLYDEWGFPSGNAGGILKEKYPEACAKRLDKYEDKAVGPGEYVGLVPDGRLMAAVAMREDTLERIEITQYIKNREILWNVPEGQWKIMIFVCVQDEWDRVDYLSKEAVSRFIEITHERYYECFKEYFGNTIDSTFYDEPQFYAVKGRTWTENFNELFEKEFGYSPKKLYPALWYDIGEETSSARYALFSFRAELYARGFVKTIQDWCTKHDIQLTGHVDQEEVLNPTGITGDLMKSFKYQDIPGVDEILEYKRAEKIYKIISSAANNYDKKLVMSETFGAMSAEMGTDILYRETMDQYAKGINLIVPHAVWLDENHDKIKYPPELSYRTLPYKSELKEYNTYTARLNVLLQEGRHVADIGVLYPIVSLNAGHYFDGGDLYNGFPLPENADYQDLGERLIKIARKDFTFLHPEIIDERCRVFGNRIKLENKENYEEYRVIIIPGSNAVALSNIKKIKEFYDNGGAVIATTKLPTMTAEFNGREELSCIISDIFGTDYSLLRNEYISRENCNGGRAYFIPEKDMEMLPKVIDEVLSVPDVSYEDKLDLNGNFTYIHKVSDNRHIYFFANSSDTCISTYVRLRGMYRAEFWNPHTGEIIVPEQKTTAEAITRVKLDLKPVESLFIIAESL